MEPVYPFLNKKYLHLDSFGCSSLSHFVCSLYVSKIKGSYKNL